jgi:hypothetical protein
VGLEARCAAALGGTRSSGKALLETTELLFRGDFRVRIPFGEIEGLEIDGERLLIRHGGQGATRTLALELGAAAAARWAAKIRSPPSRLDKLGVKPASRVAVIGRLDEDFLSELEGRVAAVVRGAPRAPVDVLFYTTEARAELDRLDELRGRIAPDGAIWVVRPKGQTAITEGDVIRAGKAVGLVGVKVAAFSPTHTAAKFVIPVAARGKPAPRPALKPSTAKAGSRRPGPSTPPTARTPPPRARGSGRRG